MWLLVGRGDKKNGTISTAFAVYSPFPLYYSASHRTKAEAGTVLVKKRSPRRLSGEPATSGSEAEAQVGMGVGTAPLAGISDEGDPFMETKVIWELDIAKLAVGFWLLAFGYLMIWDIVACICKCVMYL